MKSFGFLAIAILEGAFLCEAAAGMLKCNSDNCYRAMTNTPVVASSMCSTYLQSTTTTTITPTVTVSFTSTLPTGTLSTSLPAKLVPTHISSQCVLATATPLELRLSSACSCIGAVPTSLVTVTATAYAPAQTTTINPPTSCDLTTKMGPSGTYTLGDTTYNLVCNSFPFRSDYLGVGTVASFKDCITPCHENEGCIGIIWSPTKDGRLDGGNCGFIFAVASSVSYAPQTYFALLPGYEIPSNA